MKRIIAIAICFILLFASVQAKETDAFDLTEFGFPVIASAKTDNGIVIDGSVSGGEYPLSGSSPILELKNGLDITDMNYGKEISLSDEDFASLNEKINISYDESFIYLAISVNQAANRSKSLDLGRCIISIGINNSNDLIESSSGMNLEIKAVNGSYIFSGNLKKYGDNGSKFTAKLDSGDPKASFFGYNDWNCEYFIKNCIARKLNENSVVWELKLPIDIIASVNGGNSSAILKNENETAYGNISVAFPIINENAYLITGRSLASKCSDGKTVRNHISLAYPKIASAKNVQFLRMPIWFLGSSSRAEGMLASVPKTVKQDNDNKAVFDPDISSLPRENSDDPYTVQKENYIENRETEENFSYNGIFYYDVDETVTVSIEIDDENERKFTFFDGINIALAAVSLIAGISLVRIFDKDDKKDDKSKNGNKKEIKKDDKKIDVPIDTKKRK